MTTCKIQWIDSQGTPTPDTRPAVAMIRCKDRSVHISGRDIFIEASAPYPCCAEHLKEMPLYSYWEVVELLSEGSV